MTDMPPASPPSPQPDRRRRWGRIALIVSLGLNLLIVGIVAGSVLRGPHDRAPGARDLGFGPFFAALPRDAKRAMGDALRREAGSFRENRAALRRQFEAFLAALRATPYDAATVERLIADQRDRIGERQRLGQRLLLNRIAQMSAAERADYADRLDNLLRRRKGR